MASSVLPNVLFNYVDQLLSGYRLLRCRAPVRVDKVKTDMTFDHLCHQPIHCAAACRNRMEDFSAIGLALQSALDRSDLATNPSYTMEQLFLIANDMRHVYYTIPPNVYNDGPISGRSLLVAVPHRRTRETVLLIV